MSEAKRRLRAALAAALAEADPARAAARLAALAEDPDRAALGPETALGLPRQLQAGHLRLARRRGDLAAKIGLHATAVPGADLAGIFAIDVAARAARVAAQSAPVPRILHQIWVGGPPPDACRAWAGLAALHGWAYRLWDEAALDAIGVPADPLWRAMRAAGDLPGAVDVARYHVLAREGGVYLDCDWYPARDDLAPEAALPMAGLSVLAERLPRMVAGGSLLLSNALIAAPAGHPLFPALIAGLAEMARRLPGGPAWWVTGPLAFTLAARGGPVAVLDAGLVAGELPRAAPPAKLAALRDRVAAGPGLLIAWKGW